MKAALALAVAAAACTAPAAQHDVPGAALVPYRDARPIGAPCSYDVALGGDASPDLVYTFAYDDAGDVVHVDGVYVKRGGADDTIDYSYDNLGHLVHRIETRAPGDLRVEETFDYDTLGELVGYKWSQTAATWSNAWTETYADFDDGGNPASGAGTSAYSGGSSPFSDAFTYDASARVLRDVQTSGQVTYTTTYEYDDATSTLVTDTNAGAFHSLYAYDASGALLSYANTGTDPNEIDQTATWTYLGGEVATAVFASGTAQAPHALATTEVDTYHYDCAASATASRLVAGPPRRSARSSRAGPPAR